MMTAQKQKDWSRWEKVHRQKTKKFKKVLNKLKQETTEKNVKDQYKEDEKIQETLLFNRKEELSKNQVQLQEN